MNTVYTVSSVTTNAVAVRRREFRRTVLLQWLKYADGLDGLDLTHKENIDKHDKSAEQCDRSIWKLNNSFATKLPFHVIA